MNTLKRLERWKFGDKCRSVTIDIDDGYGACCWAVTLREGKKETTVCSFRADGDKGNFPHAYGKYNLELEVEEAPTLEETINEALRRVGNNP